MVMKLLPTKDLLQAALVSIVKLGQIAWISVFWGAGAGLSCTVGLHKAFQVYVLYLLSQWHSLGNHSLGWAHPNQERFQHQVNSPRTEIRFLRRNDASRWRGFLSMSGERKGEPTWGHLFTGTRDFIACNHLRSYKYYSDSIIYPDGFLGYPCASYDLFKEVSTSQSFGMDPIESII